MKYEVTKICINIKTQLHVFVEIMKLNALQKDNFFISQFIFIFTILIWRRTHVRPTSGKGRQAGNYLCVIYSATRWKGVLSFSYFVNWILANITPDKSLLHLQPCYKKPCSKFLKTIDLMLISMRNMRIPIHTTRNNPRELRSNP
jgi:hypothetical protein